MISPRSLLKTLAERFSWSNLVSEGLLTRVVKSSLIVDGKVQAAAYVKRPIVDITLSMDSLLFYDRDPEVGFTTLLRVIYPGKNKCTKGKFVYFDIQEACQKITDLGLNHREFRCTFTEPGSSHVDVLLHEADLSMVLADISKSRDADTKRNCRHCNPA